MTPLETICENGIAYVTPQGIDISQLQLTTHSLTLQDYAHLFWKNRFSFGIVLEDEKKRRAELYAVLRSFHKRPELTIPAIPDITLQTEHISFTPDLEHSLYKLFQHITLLDPPEIEETRVYPGKYKTVTIKKRVSNKHWWKGVFLDLYSGKNAFTDQLDGMTKVTKDVFRTKDIWKRYEAACKLQLWMNRDNAEFGRVAMGDVFGRERKIEEQDLDYSLDIYHPRLKPWIFRNETDYLYYLLGFHDLGSDPTNVHNYLTARLGAERRIQKRTQELNAEINRISKTYPDIPGIGKVKSPTQKYYFDSDITEEQLEQAYYRIMQEGDTIQSPIRIPEKMFDFGFHVFRRNRKDQKTEKSYALLKIRSRPLAAQRPLLFTGKEETIVPAADEITQPKYWLDTERQSFTDDEQASMTEAEKHTYRVTPRSDEDIPF